MKTIWKYTIGTGRTIQVPTGSTVLCAKEQHGELCLWFEVETSAALQPRTFEVFGTGHPMPEAVREYIGTAMFDGGGLVFHVYEKSA